MKYTKEKRKKIFKDLKLKIKKSHSMLKVKIFVTCGYSIRNLTLLYIGVFFAQQLISSGVGLLFFGDISPNMFDSLFAITISFLYLYYSHALGDFLLNIVLNKNNGAEVTIVDDGFKV